MTGVPTGALPVRILGVDPGLAATGYAVVAGDGGKFSVLEAGTIRTDPREPLPERLAKIHDVLAGALDRFDPHGVAVEEVFLGQNAPSAMATAEVIGVVKLLARGRTLRTYPPRQVKKWICGNGSAPKEQMLAMVKAVVGGEGSRWSDHAGDAIALALCALFEGEW